MTRLLQDETQTYQVRDYARWFASRPFAQRDARLAAESIAMTPKNTDVCANCGLTYTQHVFTRNTGGRVWCGHYDPNKISTQFALKPTQTADKPLEIRKAGIEPYLASEEFHSHCMNYRSAGVLRAKGAFEQLQESIRRAVSAAAAEPESCPNCGFLATPAAAAEVTPEAPKSLLRKPLKAGERLVCYCPPGVCQAPKGFSGPCNRAATPAAAAEPSGRADGKHWLDGFAGVKTAAEPDIDAMVNRFLSWKLPKDFSPDCGISYKPIHGGSGATGTNLFTADQARAMLEHVIAAPATQPLTDEQIVELWRKERLPTAVPWSFVRAILATPVAAAEDIPK